MIQGPAAYTVAKIWYVMGTSHFDSGWTTNRAWWSNLTNYWEKGNKHEAHTWVWRGILTPLTPAVEKHGKQEPSGLGWDTAHSAFGILLPSPMS